MPASKAKPVRVLYAPDEFVDRNQLKKDMPFLGDQAISSEIRAGRLKRHRRLGRDFFFGRDIVAWIASGGNTSDAE